LGAVSGGFSALDFGGTSGPLEGIPGGGESAWAKPLVAEPKPARRETAIRWRVFIR
jgi:hypothetical protein